MRYYNTCVYDRTENLLRNTVIDVDEKGIITRISQQPGFVPSEDDYDCMGMVAVSGFMDCCVTLPGSQIFKLFGTDLSHYNNFDDYMYTLASVQADKGIRGYGYNTFVVGDEGPAKIKKLLDRRFPNTPSYIFADDMTTVIVNDCILEVAKEYFNVDRELHIDGQLDVFEINMLRRNTDVFTFSPDEVQLALMAFQGDMLENGIIAIRVMDVFGDMGTLKVMKSLSDRGLWKLVTVVVAPLYPFDTTEEMWDRYAEYRELEGKNIYVTGVSLTLDGSIDSGQAALLEPYEIDKTWYGDILWNTLKLRKCVREFIKAGIDVNINATGDKAVSEATTVLTFADDEYTDGQRTITHGYLISDLDIETCSRADIIMCIEPNSVPYNKSFYEGDVIMVGDRVYMEYPVGRLVAKGVRVIAGSNFPMHQEISPMKGVYKATHRTSADDATPYQVLCSYRETPYEAFGLAGELGDITVGRRASFILVNKDIVNMREDLFCDTKYVATVVDGEVMWQNEEIVAQE